MKALIVAREQALVDQMVSLVAAEGLDIAGTTNDEQAAAQITSGQVSALVIGGGVDDASREHLAQLANQEAVAVIHGALKGKNPEAYAREELVPQLRTTAT